jgi:hypothetical protein
LDGFCAAQAELGEIPAAVALGKLAERPSDIEIAWNKCRDTAGKVPAPQLSERTVKK